MRSRPRPKKFPATILPDLILSLLALATATTSEKVPRGRTSISIFLSLVSIFFSHYLSLSRSRRRSLCLARIGHFIFFPLIFPASLAIGLILSITLFSPRRIPLLSHLFSRSLRLSIAPLSSINSSFLPPLFPFSPFFDPRPPSPLCFFLLSACIFFFIIFCSVCGGYL